MKKIVASVGLVALGASGLQAALLDGLTADSGKPWNLSATLRGFYDDNFNTYPNDVYIAHRGSTGFEVSPSLQFNFPMEQTTLSFGYVYSLKYYEYKPINDTENYDQTHDFSAALTHAFSERYQLSVRDDFVIGQEPDFLRAGNTYTTFQRISGDNERNYGAIDFTAQITPELGLVLGYANTFYSYADNAYVVNPPSFGYPAGTITPSNSGLLDELDHVVHLDLRYPLQPQTIGVVGYQFRETDYIGNQPIGINPVNGQYIMSDDRNARSQYLYLGLDHNFRPDLTGSVRVGGYYTDYYNDPSTGQNGFSPYAMLNLQYTYLPESSLQFGFSYDYSATSAFTVAGLNSSNPGSFTVSATSATVFAALNHRIAPKLYGSITAQYQNSAMNGGYYDNMAQNYYLVGLNLQYRFTPNFSAEVGYNYDDLNNYLPGQDYDRNRIYIGVTGSY
ncbi:MAG: outer membrane beta-barrel protein [Verrucomicrobiota bacterium]|jgi:hypothetical protein